MDEIVVHDMAKKKMNSMDAMCAQRMNNDDVHSMDILSNQSKRYSRKEILNVVHRNYQGVDNTLQDTRQKVHCHGLNADIRRVCNACRGCQCQGNYMYKCREQNVPH